MAASCSPLVCALYREHPARLVGRCRSTSSSGVNSHASDASRPFSNTGASLAFHLMKACDCLHQRSDAKYSTRCGRMREWTGHFSSKRGCMCRGRLRSEGARERAVKTAKRAVGKRPSKRSSLPMHMQGSLRFAFMRTLWRDGNCGNVNRRGYQ